MFKGNLSLNYILTLDQIVETLNNDNSLVNALCAAKFDGNGRIPMLCSNEETERITEIMNTHSDLKINVAHGKQQHYKRAKHMILPLANT